MDKTVDLLDVSIIREQEDHPVIIRLAYLNPHLNTQASALPFKVGDYIRGNIWIQASIYATNKGE
jgi:hypothetical protein